MTAEQTIQRKLFLKRQAVSIIRHDCAELRVHLFLLKLKSKLEKQIAEEFDPILSRRLDAVQVLLEEAER
jgi:hypothetical protein